MTDISTLPTKEQWAKLDRAYRQVKAIQGDWNDINLVEEKDVANGNHNTSVNDVNVVSKAEAKRNLFTGQEVTPSTYVPPTNNNYNNNRYPRDDNVLKNPNYRPKPEMWPQETTWCYPHRVYGSRCTRCAGRGCTFDVTIHPNTPPTFPAEYDPC